MSNVDLPLVLTRPPEEVRRLPLSVIDNLLILCFSGQHVSELHMYHVYFFLICACTCSTCSFVVFASAAVAHGIIMLLKKSISYFMNIMYKRI